MYFEWLTDDELEAKYEKTVDLLEELTCRLGDTEEHMDLLICEQERRMNEEREINRMMAL